MGLVRLKEGEGQYNDAVSLLVNNNKMDEALKCARRYESEGHILKRELLASTLAIRYAKMCLHEHAHTEKARTKRLVRLVGFMGDPMDRVYYLKIAKKYRDAFDVLCNERKFDEAYTICAAQGWVDEGLKLAEEKKDQDWKLQFIFQKAIASLCEDTKVDGDIVKRLHSICDNKVTVDDQIKAKACLLFGKSNNDFFYCRRAFDVYLSTQNAAGCVEAFNLMTQFSIKGNKSTEITIKQILETCKLASDIIQLLNCFLERKPLSAAQEYKLTLLEKFYGLQKNTIGDQQSYFLTPMQHIWVRFYSEHGACDTDNDGMIKVDSSRALKVIRSHVQEFLKRWKVNDELQVCQRFRELLSLYRFHKQLEDGGRVKQSFTITYKGRQLYAYMKQCCLGIELSEFGNGEIKNGYIIQLLISVFKPKVAVYLGVTRGQMEWLATCPCATILEQYSIEMLQKSDRDFRVDDWLVACTILRILRKDHLLRKLISKRTVKMLTAKDNPSIYKYTQDEHVYVHIFSLWMRSCNLIQEEKRIITSSKVMLHYFLGTIIRDRKLRLTLSASHVVNVLTIHTTALLSLTALCNVLQRKQSNVLFPSSYERVLNVFDNVGKLANGNCISVLEACMNDGNVLKAYDKMRVNPRAIENIQRDITDLLWQILDILLGIRLKYFHPLKNAMSSDICIKGGDTRHCLLLCLVLLGNLTEIDQQCTQNRIQDYHQRIVDTFRCLNEFASEECQTLRKVLGMFSFSSNTTGFFLAIHHLITTADPHDHIIRMNARQHPFWKYEQEVVRMSQFPSRPLLPTVIKPDEHSVHGPAESTSEQTTTNNGGSLSPTSGTATELKSQIGMELEEDEIAEYVEDDDEELKNLPLAAPFILDRQPSETNPDSEQTNSITASASMWLDEMFCGYCGVPLKPDETVEPTVEHDEGVPDEQNVPSPEEESDETSVETYTAHCKSDKHNNNVKAHSIFTNYKRDYYEPLKEKLHEVLKVLKTFDNENYDSNLRSIIQQIEKELGSNESHLNELMSAAEWKKGASQMECDMQGRMESLIANAEGKLSNERARIHKERQLREQAASVETPAVEDDDLLDGDDGSQSEEEISRKLDPSEAKEKERQRKKARKKAKRGKR